MTDARIAGPSQRAERHTFLAAAPLLPAEGVCGCLRAFAAPAAVFRGVAGILNSVFARTCGYRSPSIGLHVHVGGRPLLPRPSIARLLPGYYVVSRAGSCALVCITRPGVHDPVYTGHTSNLNLMGSKSSPSRCALAMYAPHPVLSPEHCTAKE